MEKWTRERVIREILTRESTGQKLSNSRRNGVDSKLYQAGSRVFGSWCNALLAAGISPALVRLTDRWPPEKILATIRSLSQKGRLNQPYDNLVKAAQRRFGSWAKAVTAAGVDPAKIRRAPRWTREEIIEGILARALDNAPLASKKVRPRSLSDAGAKIFGSWRAALAAAGVKPAATIAGVTSISDRMPDADAVANGSAQGQSWTKQGIIDAILARLREQKPINANAVRCSHRSLYSGGERHFGNWSKALAAAGLNPEEFQKGRGCTVARR